MDISKIKELVKQNGDKVIVMENGEPELVVMSFAEYEKLARLHLPEAKMQARMKPSPQVNEPMPRESEDERMHETEFLAPINTAPIRNASMMGYSRPIVVEEQEELRRSADIRLEDLPI